MGFVMRLNSRDLVNDPKNGAEVYPITATNAVYRAGTDKNLEQILSELSNNADRKVIQDLEYLSNTNTLQISYTDNTTDNIQLSNLIKNVAVTRNNRTYTITVTPTTGSASTYTIELPNVTTSGSGNGLSDISYDSSTNTITATKTTFLTEHQQIPVTDVKVNNASVVTNKVANITVPIVGTLNTNNSQAQTASSSESFSNNISLHKVSKTGNYNDLLNKPTIPSAPGTLNTNNTSSQTASASEALSGTIKLHKVSKTGNYNDLLNLPAGLGAYPVISAEYDSTEGANIITFHKEISNRISTITLTPTIDTTNRRQLYKCRIVNDGTTDPLNWTEGNVLVKLPKDSTYAPYLLVNNTSGPDSQSSEMINNHHFDNAIFTPQESVSLSENYNIYPIQAHINWVTRNGHVNSELYYTTLFKCFSNNTVTFDLLNVKGYYLMIPVDTSVPVANYGGIGKMKYISETDYNNLTYKDPDCLYFIPVTE